MIEVVELPNIINADHHASELLKFMLTEHIGVIEPVLAPATNLGYAYPMLENELQIATEELVALLESLSSEGILQQQILTNLLLCPACNSSNLRSTTGCPACGSEKITRGRILEHFACGNLNLEDEYIVNGRYICPRCNKEVQFLGKEYMSIGVKYRCQNCEHIFEKPALLKQCLKCSQIFFEIKSLEKNVNSYRLGPEQKARLDFEFGLKKLLKDFLQKKGYAVTENARVTGPSKSGAEHTFNLLARRFDGLIDYTLCIDAAINANNDGVGLDDIFRFDNKAYDLGIHDKVLLAIPGLNEQARKFANKQRITVFNGNEIEDVMNLPQPTGDNTVLKEPAIFKNRNEICAFLSLNGYDVQENVKIRGRSGVEHQVDIYATMNDGIIHHSVGIGVLISDKEIGIDSIFPFDTRAYDIRVHDKVLLVSPGLDKESSLFAEIQGIKVIKLGN